MRTNYDQTPDHEKANQYSSNSAGRSGFMAIKVALIFFSSSTPAEKLSCLGWVSFNKVYKIAYKKKTHYV